MSVIVEKMMLTTLAYFFEGWSIVYVLLFYSVMLIHVQATTKDQMSLYKINCSNLLIIDDNMYHVYKKKKINNNNNNNNNKK